MSAPRRFLLALAGTEDAALPEFVAKLIGAGEPQVEIDLVHVVEAGPHELAGYDAIRRREPWPLPKPDAIDHRLADADDEETAELLALWRQRFELALPGIRITSILAQGRPEQEIVAAAQRLNPDAVVICARPRTGPTEPGPHGVGHVARFVLDHSPVPVVLMRRLT
jgi:nucleotide-binding universal stress UspA family protein